jgi:hypothetical protein
MNSDDSPTFFLSKARSDTKKTSVEKKKGTSRILENIKFTSYFTSKLIIISIIKDGLCCIGLA